MNRRNFISAAAGGLLATLPTGPLWSTQTTGLRRPQRVPEGPAGLSPRWVPTTDLQRRLPRLLELAAVPALAVATVDGGRIVALSAGQASLEPRRGAGDGTVFEAASLGKPLFAYAVLRLIDAGVLDPRRPLYDYLPVPEADTPRMRRVTATHVLSHTTGLPNWRRANGPLTPATEPGSAYTYSGEGFFFLQRVVERITDRPVARYLREALLEPLGMHETSWVWRPGFDDRMAVGYEEAGRPIEVYAVIGSLAAGLARTWKQPVEDWRYADTARAVALMNPAWPTLPLYMVPNVAASLLTTARDYARFLEHLVTEPPSASVGLSPALREAMMTPHVRINSALSWGLGWGIQQDEAGTALWQWGANNGFRNFVVAEPAHARAVAVLTNSAEGPRVYERVIAGITGRDHPAFLHV